MFATTTLMVIGNNIEVMIDTYVYFQTTIAVLLKHLLLHRLRALYSPAALVKAAAVVR
jgi:hypothetical protein